jgi:hypothetical protein
VKKLANLNREKLEAEKQKILERKKTLDSQLKKINALESELSRREETTKGMTFWRFVSSHKPELFKDIIKSPEFDAYVDRDHIRKLFDLTPLGSSPVSPVVSSEEKPEVKTQEQAAESVNAATSFVALLDKAVRERIDKRYLETKYEERVDVRKAGAEWDADMKKWYVPDNAELSKFEQWKPQTLTPDKLLAALEKAFKAKRKNVVRPQPIE